MTDEEIIALAVAHRLGEIEQDTPESHPQLITDYGDLKPSVLAFARELMAAEREACAKVCDDIAADRWALYKGRVPYAGTEDGRAHMQTQGENIGAEACAEAIRARGK